MKYQLVRVTDTSGQNSGLVGANWFMGLTELELRNLWLKKNLHDYLHNKQFQIEQLGIVEIPSLICIEDENTKSYSNINLRGAK